MKITVKLFATLREYNDNQFEFEIVEGDTVLDIVRKLNLPEKEIAIIMINGRGKKIDQKLEENDILALFPPVGGG